MKVLVTGIAGLLLGLTLHAQQPGLVDPTFNVSDTGLWNGHGIDALSFTLKDAVVEADGSFIVGGDHRRYDGYAKRGLVRVRTDGSCDPAFPAGVGPNGAVEALALQPDGKIIVGGTFTRFNGVLRNSLVRLETNGTLDLTFPELTSGSTVRDLSVGPDGTVFALVAGNIRRYSPSGTYLGAIGVTNNSTVFRFQADGKVILAGSFLRGIERRSSTGAGDQTFVVGTGFNDIVYDIQLLPDGDIIAVGAFTAYQGSPCPGIARLNPDGSLDGTFDPGTGFTLGAFSKWQIQVDDTSILVNGPIMAYNGTERVGAVRLSFTGALLDFDAHANGVISCMVQSNDGGFFIAGAFTMVSGEARMRRAMLHADGSLQEELMPVASGLCGSATTVAVQANGRILCGGGFTGYNGRTRPHFVGIRPDGGFDEVFNSGSGFDGPVNRMEIDGQGRIVVVGGFAHYNGISRKGIARLHSDGSLDLTFDPGLGFEHTSGIITAPQALCIQSDGRYLVGGGFMFYQGQVRKGLVRLMPDGALDTSFDGTFLTGTTSSRRVYTIAQRPDGRIICGGHFYEFNGQTNRHVVQLFVDGSTDTSFDTDPGFTGSLDDVYDLEILPNGEVIVGGWFFAYNSVNWQGALKLDPNGVADPSFRPFTSGVRVQRIVPLPDGRLLLVGDSDNQMKGVAVVLPNGSVDGTFQIGAGPASDLTSANYIHDIALDGQGRAIVTGSFGSFQGLPRNNLARIQVHAEQSVRISAKVFLEGAYDQTTAQMRDDLRAAGHLPLMEPYTALGYARAGAASESTSSGVFAQTGPDAIVDWVLLELRHAHRPDSILATRSALVQRDGDIVDVDGSSPVLFTQWPGTYHLAIRHRNHLSVMTRQPIGLHGSATTMDFTLPTTPTFGDQAQRPIGDRTALRSGNVNGDGKVSYTGAANDRDPILVRIGGTVPTNTATGYLREDVNMNGQVLYTGANNDRDIILVNIGGVVPTHFIVEQLP